jgi:RNA polymerase sigma factor (sigma-70 family)
VYAPEPLSFVPIVPGGPDARVELAFADYAPRIRAFMLGSTRDPQVAEDLTQEAFLRLLAEARAGRAPDNVGGWLYRTASNLAVSRARHQAVARKAEPRLVDRATVPGPEILAIEGERSGEVRRALATLGEAERTAVVLAAQGVGMAEIADRLGKSPVAVRTMICRARGRMRLRLLESGLTSAA